ncbi:MAG: prolyl oligopeptidase family serine peptidase [Pseudomonadota bacterium]
MQNDVIDAVSHLYEAGVASPENTCIVGYSYGGYVALHAAAFTPQQFKCIVSGGGVSDLLASMKEERREKGKDSEAYDYWLKSIGDPETQREKLISASPINFADRVTAPVLLIHGEEDKIVYANQSRRMKKALEKAGADVEYLELAYEGHRYWSLENEVLYLRTIEGFLAKHLVK